MKLNLRTLERFKIEGGRGLRMKGIGFSHYSILNNVDAFEERVLNDSGIFIEKDKLIERIEEL